jgi:MFS family permease
MGCGWSVWLLARLSFVTDAAPVAQRGRALSLLGGANRIGNFVGPFLGGFSAIAFGLGSAFVIQAVLALAASAVLYLAAREPNGYGGAPAHGTGVSHSVPRILREHGNIFLTAGAATVAIQVLRTGRQVVIPLWGESIGLDAAQIGIIFGISSGLDMIMFYPVGVVMDRWGRKWTAIPCLLLMSAGLFLVPLTEGFGGLALVGLLTGFGNGMGSGIVMTLGADFSPAVGRGEFLGVWRLIGDIGTAGGPVVVSAVAGVATLGVASVAAGAIGVGGSIVMALFVTEPLHRYRHAIEVEPATPQPGPGA